MFGLSVGVGYQVSNANQISDLGGWFGMGGGSVSVGPDIGGDGFTGLGACNQQIIGGDVQAGMGFFVDPNVFPMWEIHGGATDTWQTTFFHVNLWNAAKEAVSGFFGWLLG